MPVHAEGPELEMVTEEWPPYNYTGNGKITGISTRVVTETLHRAGIRFRITVYPWKRAYTMALRDWKASRRQQRTDRTDDANTSLP